MTPYEKYCASMREYGLEPSMTEPQLLEAWGIKPPEHIPFVSRKSASHRNIEPTLANHEGKPTAQPLRVNLLDYPVQKDEIIKPKNPNAANPPKAKKELPPKKYTDEEIKQRRAEAKKQKREELKAQGLTIRGTPRVVREKKVISDEERKERNRRYAATYNEKNKEKVSAYREEYKAKQAEVAKRYRERNIDSIRAKEAETKRERRKSDPAFAEREREINRRSKEKKRLQSLRENGSVSKSQELIVKA